MERTSSKWRTQFTTIVMVIILLLAPPITIATVGTETSSSVQNTHRLTQQTTDQLPDKQTLTVTDNISVWERSILPLRTDMSDAAWTAKNAMWHVTRPGIGTTALNKSQLGVFNQGTEITLFFTREEAQGNFNTFSNQNVTLIAAQLKSPAETSRPSVTSFSDALSLLNTTNKRAINRNLSFTHVETTKLDATTGNGKFSFSPKTSGQYVFFLALGNQTTSNLSVRDHDLSVTGDVSIVGVEQALVQEQSSDAQLTQDFPVRGQNLTFDVTEQLHGDEVRHAVLVYDAQTGYQDQWFNVNVTGNPENVSELANQTILNHSVSYIHGVARIEDGVTVLGNNLSDRHVGTSPTVGTLLDRIATETRFGRPENNTVGLPKAPGGQGLDASLTAQAGNPGTITVETLDTWNPTTYRWVHVTVNEDGDLRTQTGTFDIARYAVTQTTVSDSAITAGEAVTVTATIKNTWDDSERITVPFKINGETRDHVTTDLASGETTTITFTQTFTTTGTYTVSVGDTTVGTIDVTARQDTTTPGESTTTTTADDGTTTPTTGGSTTTTPPADTTPTTTAGKTTDDDDTSSGGGGGAPSLGPPPISIATSQQGDGSAVADIRNGRTGTPVTVTIPRKQATRISGVSFDRVDINLATDNAHFKLTLNTFADQPATVSTSPPDVAPKGYLQVEKTYLTNKEIGTATIHFQLAANQLSAHSTPKNIVLYRYHNGTWTALETTFRGKQNGQYTFKAVTPGFSVFAIGERQPQFSLSNVALDQSSVTVGETVQVTAEITNDGTGEGTYTAELVVGDTVTQTKQVTVGAGDSETVTFTYTAEEAGEQTLAIGETSVGTLSVTDADDSDTTTTTTTTTPDAAETKTPTSTTSAITPTETTDDESDGMSAIGIVIAILLLLGGAGGTLYYYRDEVEATLKPYLESYFEEYRNR